MAAERDMSNASALDPRSLRRLEEKLLYIDKTDPSSVPPEQWSTRKEDLPAVAMPDIFAYLVLKCSAYTNEQFKAYKGLKSYNQFISGWVQEVMVHKPPGAINVVVKGKVMHSQRISEKPAESWIIVAPDSSILCGHCTCVAGLGETCSHVAAVLFMLEACTRLRDKITVTGEPAYWMMPASIKKVEPALLSDMDFSSAKSQKARLDATINSGSDDCLTPPPKKYKGATKLSKQSFSKFLNNVFKSRCNSAIFTVLPEYQNCNNSNNVVPKYLCSIFREDMAGQPLSVLKACQVDLNVTEEELKNAEELTRLQAGSKVWCNLREGRVTASKFYDVCHTKIEKPSLSLIKSICYARDSVKSLAMKWGIDNEPAARDGYKSVMVKTHREFSLETCGLFLHRDYPFIGAPPDGIVNCACCGKGCIEIKCPLKVKENSIRDIANSDPNFCLEIANGGYRLKESHSYYYQVQAQMFVTDTKYSDFIVWSPKEIFIQRISANKTFINSKLPIIKDFFDFVLKPELLAHHFTTEARENTENKNCGTPSPKKSTSSAALSPSKNNPQISQVWCICRGDDSGRMIACDNQQCPIQWFHFQCMDLKSNPKGKWYCSECRKLDQFKRPRKAIPKYKKKQ